MNKKNKNKIKNISKIKKIKKSFYFYFTENGLFLLGPHKGHDSDVTECTRKKGCYTGGL